MKVFIPLSFMIIGLGFAGNYFMYKANHLYTTVALIALTVLSLAVLSVKSFSNMSLNKINKEMCSKMIDLFNKTNSLLNLFCSYFDNNFILINILHKHGNDESEFLHNYKKINTMLNDYKENIITLNSCEIKKLNKDNCKMLNCKIETLIKEINEFEIMFSNLEGDLFSHMKEKITETSDKKEMFHKLVVEYQLYSEIIYDFVNSIRGNIENTSKPLSEEIFIIRQNVHDFINKIHAWKNDLSDERTNKNFNNVILKYNAQNEEFQNIFDRINRNYVDLDLQFNNIISMIENVYKNSFQIQDISERIKLLSINASIEAAHSEKSGKGFKVIADEVKKLSEVTKTIITNTVTLINESKIMVEKTIYDFNTSSKEITGKVDRQKKEFNIFYDILEGYYENFNTIFKSVSELTDKIADHIDKFSPIFQMHDISIQELGNLNKMITKFLHDNKDIITSMNAITDKNVKDGILQDLLGSIEKKITTSNEIIVINNIYKRYDINKEIVDNRVAEIEFF
jgi:methyl-accepting chemotaxis protein